MPRLWEPTTPSRNGFVAWAWRELRRLANVLSRACYEHEAAYITGERRYDHASGYGFTLGDETQGDYAWRDIIGQILTRGDGATDPTWAQIGAGPFYAYAFAVNDVAWLAFHVPHDIVPGSDVHFHIHWLPSGTDTNSVKWQFDYSYAKGFDQENFSATGSSVTAEESPPGTAYRHMVTESAGVTIAGLTEPDGIIMVKITRITNGATDNANTIFVLLSDVHYQSTSFGTVNKAPTFYGT